MPMTYPYVAIPDEEVPRASAPVFQHLLDTYAGETNKVVSVWREFSAADLPFVTLVERKSGLVLVGKLPDRTADSLSRRAVGLIKAHGARFATVTADNGTELHGYER